MKRIGLIGLIGLIALVAGSYFYFVYDPEPKEPPPEGVTVTEAIDGLTVRVNTGHRIRYIGAYLPSPDNCFGDKSLEGNTNLIGKEIRLEMEPLLERSADKAWVRYVWVMPEKDVDPPVKPEDDREALGDDNKNPVIPAEAGIQERGSSAFAEDDKEALGDDNKNPVIPAQAGIQRRGSSAAVYPRAASGAEDDKRAAEDDNKAKEILINEKILEMGLGFALVSEDMKHGSRMLSAARYAQATGRGMWSQCEIVEGENGRADTADLSDPSVM